MIRHLSFLIPLLLAAAYASSQDSIQSNLSQDSSIRSTLIEGIKYPRLIYSANGQILSNRDIFARLRLYPAPAAELKRSQDARTGQIIWLGVMLASRRVSLRKGLLQVEGNNF